MLLNIRRHIRGKRIPRMQVVHCDIKPGKVKIGTHEERVLSNVVFAASKCL